MSQSDSRMLIAAIASSS